MAVNRSSSEDLVVKSYTRTSRPFEQNKTIKINRGKKERKHKNKGFETAKHKNASSVIFLALCVCVWVCACVCSYRENFVKLLNSFQKMMTHTGHRFYRSMSGIYLAIVFTDSMLTSVSLRAFSAGVSLLTAKLLEFESQTA